MSSTATGRSLTPTPVDFKVDGTPFHVCIRNQLGLIKKCVTLVDGTKDASKAVLANLKVNELPDRIGLEQADVAENERLLNRAEMCRAAALSGTSNDKLSIQPDAVNGSLVSSSRVDNKEIAQITAQPIVFDNAQTTVNNLISSAELLRRLKAHETVVKQMSAQETIGAWPPDLPKENMLTKFPGIEPVILSCRNLAKSFSPVDTGNTWHWRSSPGNYGKLYDNFNISANGSAPAFTIPDNGIYFLSYDENISYQFTTTTQNDTSIPTANQSIDQRKSTAAFNLVIAAGSDVNNLTILQEQAYYLPDKNQIYMTIMSVCYVAYLTKGTQIRFGFKLNGPTTYYDQSSIMTANIGGMHIAQLNYMPKNTTPV